MWAGSVVLIGIFVVDAAIFLVGGYLVRVCEGEPSDGEPARRRTEDFPLLAGGILR